MSETIKKNNSIVNDKNKSANGKRVRITVLQYAVLVIIAAFLVFPFILMVSRSLMGIKDINAAKVFPTFDTFSTQPLLQNYITIFQNNNYWLYTFNTVKVVVINMVLVPLAASVCAYSFARLKWKGSGLVFACVMSTIMIPGTVLQVPLYVMFYDFGWIGTLKPLIIPAMFGGGAINIFLFKQFMRSVPKEIDEAAMMDGAGTFKRLLLLLPLCSPILLYIMINTFASGWSDFMGPLIYLTKRETYTLAVAIYQDSLVSDYLNTSNVKMAAGTFMALLPALVFLLYQRKLVDGIMMGAVKG